MSTNTPEKAAPEVSGAGVTEPASVGGLRSPWWISPKIIAPAVAMLVVLVGVGAYLGVSGWRHQQAISAWEEAASAQQSAVGALTIAISDAQSVLDEAQSLNSSVEEAQSLPVAEEDVEALDTALSTARGIDTTVPARPADTVGLTQGVEQLNAATTRAEQATDALSGATGSVDAQLTAHATSALAEAVKSHSAAADEADKLVGESEGKVADNATREALSEAVAAMRELLGAADGAQGAARDGLRARVLSLEAARADLDEAAEKVRASREEWQKNEDAKNQQAGGGTVAPANGYTGGGYTGGGYTNNGGGHVAGGGGGYTPPANNGGSSTPAPSGGGNTGGGFNWDEDWTASSTCDEFNNCVDHW